MDFVRRILDLFKKEQIAGTSQFTSFVYVSDVTSSEFVVTVHADETGYLIFSIFSPDEWAMIVDICELTSRDIEDVVREISDDENITNIAIDPRDIDNE
jgi:hypothetical protein